MCLYSSRTLTYCQLYLLYNFVDSVWIRCGKHVKIKRVIMKGLLHHERFIT